MEFPTEEVIMKLFNARCGERKKRLDISAG